MYEEILNPLKEKMEKTIEHFKHEISALRTGRASSALVEDLRVEYYGSLTPLNQIASITVQPPSTIVIKPWDRGAVAPIESAIRNSQLGLAPIAESDFVRINIPTLTQERREQLIKILGQKMEEAKVSIRQEREYTMKAVDKNEKDGIFSEDDKFKSKEAVQKMVDAYNEKIKEARDAKEKDILNN
ncbi:ribosome recycling factor [Candidatus Azambacteria bacterium]|nr:ribosome recycling factor [Candidatus Azambacteria bacterium]